MAAVSIKTNTKNLRNGATKVKSELATIKTELTRLRSEGKKLNSYWSGTGHDEFEKKFNNDCDEVQDFIAEVEKYYTDIEKVAQNYEAGEKAVVNLASTRVK